MEELYYSHPVQVKYWDAEVQKYVGGIAYQDFLIDGPSGKACLLTDIIDTAAKDGKSVDEAIIELDWITINVAILGD